MGKIGTFIGTALARTADPPFKKLPDENVAKRSFDGALSKIYLYPIKLAGIDRSLKTSFGIDATFYEMKTKAVILLADYISRKPRNINIEVSFENKYKKCKTIDGKTLKINQKGIKTLISNVPIKNTQILFLE